MAPNKASVDNSTTIRAASRNKQRAHPSNRSAPNPFGSSTSGSLASSLSSLFSPHPHGKDAALASLLAANSSPPVNLGQGSGLAAFGSFSNTQPADSPSSKPTAHSLDDKLKRNKKEAASQDGAIESAPTFAKPGASSALPVVANSREDTKAPGPKHQQKLPGASRDVSKSTQSSTSVSSTASKPVVPNLPPGRKPVFRPVLASSTAVSWPEMPVAGAKTVLHTLLEILALPVIQDALRRDLGNRTRADTPKVKPAEDGNAMDVDANPHKPAALASPQVLAGINSITRAVEQDIATDLHKLQAPGPDDTQTKNKAKGKEKEKDKQKIHVAPPSIKVIFVCRQDLPQPGLIAHLPMLVTARNAVLQACAADQHTNTERVLLFALPSGSEHLVAKALCLRRASILALTSAFSPLHLTQLLAAIHRETGTSCYLRAAWIETALLAAKHSTSHLPLPLPQQPTSIKLLRTSHPSDLNACKAANKSRRKQRSVRWKQRKLQTQQRIRSLRAQLKHASNRERKAANRAPKTRTDTAPIAKMDTT